MRIEKTYIQKLIAKETQIRTGNLKHNAKIFYKRFKKIHLQALYYIKNNREYISIFQNFQSCTEKYYYQNLICIDKNGFKHFIQIVIDGSTMRVQLFEYGIEIPVAG